LPKGESEGWKTLRWLIVIIGVTVCIYLAVQYGVVPFQDDWFWNFMLWRYGLGITLLPVLLLL
jgi:hypothetical protein